MGALTRLRKWAEDEDHTLGLDRAETKDVADELDPDDPESTTGIVWRMSVDLTDPVVYHASSGWQNDVETAAYVLLEQLVEVGEAVPE